MKKPDYTTSITVPVSTEQAFNTINNVTAWWSGSMEGRSEKLNDVFTVRFGETFITIKITELVPCQTIGWEVINCYKHFLKDKTEWKGTNMLWKIASANNATTIHFTHTGLVPGIECYNVCEKAWDYHVKDVLFKLLTAEKKHSV